MLIPKEVFSFTLGAGTALKVLFLDVSKLRHISILRTILV